MKLLVRVDGVSRGELGGSAISVVVRDEGGAVLDRRSEVVEAINATDTQARYGALIEALDMVQHLDADEVMFVTDSPEFQAALTGTATPGVGCEAMHGVTVRALDWALPQRWNVVWVPLERVG